MSPKRSLRETLLGYGLPLLAFLAVLALLAYNAPAARAADLGGNCCGDLEERVAELEATAAHKGNRKVSLEVSGQVNMALTDIEVGDYSQHKIGQNGNDESFLKVSGRAQISPEFVAGYVLELNISQLEILNLPVGSNEPLTRQSYWFLGSKTAGTISMGRQAQATNDFDEHMTNKAWLAGKPLSFGALRNVYLTGLDLPFDGDYRNTIKYVSPELQGFTLSATWGASVDGKAKDGTGDAYDVALRYDSHDLWKELHVMGAVGYRRSTDFDINLLNILNVQIPTGDVDAFLASGSLLNPGTGLFVNGMFARSDYKDMGFVLQGWDVTAGWQSKQLLPVGATEVFGSYGRIAVQPDGLSDTNVNYYGVGMTQALDAAAMDLYAGWRRYQTNDILNSDVDSFNVGARIKF